MKIGVIGLGLIGGSIFRDLMSSEHDVIGISQSQEGENIYKDYSLLKDCEIVFVCSAMNKTLEVLDKLEDILPPETIVSDVCSVKSFVCQKQRPYNFIPSHPMAGTEHKGFEHSFKGLFTGAKWVVTPFKNQQVPEQMFSLIKELGAEPVVTSPQEHDEAVALISHMPMLIAQAIFKTAQDNELALKLASSGFRDMTRLAMSNPEMANDMISINAQNIENAILKLYKSVGELTNENYEKQIETIRQKRSQMFQIYRNLQL